MKELLSFVLLSYLIGWDRADTFPKIEWSEKQNIFSQCFVNYRCNTKLSSSQRINLLNDY